jgi:hypothetical protein
MTNSLNFPSSENVPIVKDILSHRQFTVVFVQHVKDAVLLLSGLYVFCWEIVCHLDGCSKVSNALLLLCYL